MTAGIDTTWDLLATTANEAVADVLIPALDSPWPAIRDNAFKILLERRNHAGQSALLRRLHRMDEAWREQLFEHREGLTRAVRDAALDPDPQTCANGCEALVWFHEYELMAALVNAVEADGNPHVDLHAAAVLRLAEELLQELSLPRDDCRRIDPQRSRAAALSCLEQSLLKFGQHGRKEIVEAFLVLVSRENAAYKAILANPRHGSYLPLIDLLLHSDRPGVIRLVLSSLDDPHPTSAALSVLSRRQSPKFIRHLLKKIGQEPSAAAAANLKKIESLAWARPDAGIIQGLDDDEQHSLIRLVAASGQKRTDALETVEFILRHGLPAGRRAAAAALKQFSGGTVNRLSMDALDDEDPHVQAAAIKQIRPRGLPGVLGRLIELADSPHGVVRAAVRETMTEFRFGRYLAAFDALDDDVRRSTGVLVRKIDTQTISQLSAEFYSPVRTRRLRAIAVSLAIQAAPAVEMHLRAALLNDSDHFVRVEAAKALSYCDTPSAAAALQEALEDTSLLVRDVAKRGLDELASRGIVPNRWPPTEEPAHE
ncbi:MAG: HEAT repeat domain-containing protein [Pirellulales bacterium]